MSYPAIPALSADCKELTLDVDVLVNGINKTIFATADDELRPVMNGVYINLALRCLHSWVPTPTSW